jgi:hypothetical protein
MAMPSPHAALRYLNLEALESSAAQDDPFRFVAMTGLVRDEKRGEVVEGFPKLPAAGQFLPGSFPHTPAFGDFLGELRHPRFVAALGDKLGVELAGRAQLVTLRGHMKISNGDAHTDSPNRLATLLAYPNEHWNAEGGRLRILNGPDLNDVAAELPPTIEHAVAFVRSDNSYHGHLPYVGPRNVVQVQWMKNKFSYWVALLKMARGAWLKSHLKTAE